MHIWEPDKVSHLLGEERSTTMLHEKAERQLQKAVNKLRKERARLCRTMVQHRFSDVVFFNANAISELRTDVANLMSTME